MILLVSNSNGVNSNLTDDALRLYIKTGFQTPTE